MIFLKNKKTTITNLSDKELVQLILQEKDPEKLRYWQEELYNRYADIIYKTSLTIIADISLAKDITHDILVKVFTKLHTYQGNAHFYSWIKRITYNHCINFLAKKKKWHLEELDSDTYDLAIDEIELEHKMLLEVELEQMEQAFEQLPENERLILMMRYQDGMSVKKIKEVMKISESAVKMRLKRSRDHLAQLIKKG